MFLSSVALLLIHKLIVRVLSPSVPLAALYSYILLFVAVVIVVVVAAIKLYMP